VELIFSICFLIKTINFMAAYSDFSTIQCVLNIFNLYKTKVTFAVTQVKV
jgi:hypothetical protein